MTKSIGAVAVAVIVVISRIVRSFLCNEKCVKQINWGLNICHFLTRVHNQSRLKSVGI